MKITRLLAISLALVALTAAVAWAAEEKKEKSLKETLNDLLPGMSAEQLSQRAEPQQKWQDICFQAGAPGNEAVRAEACKLMAEKLGADLPAPARIWLLEQLRYIGREECVGAVAPWLDDKDVHVRDAARRALAKNPSPEALAKLRAKLANAADARFKAGLINVLGDRGDEAAVPALAQELSNRESLVAEAAARALGKIGSAEAAQALGAARAKARGDLRRRISDSCLLCADKLLKEGKAQDAAAIYKQLNSKDEPRGVRLAALKGVLATADDQAGTMILGILAGDDADARKVATGQIGCLSAEAAKSLAGGLAKLPPAGQVALLDALAARRVKSAQPAALVLVNSGEESVKLAAMHAIGSVGDSSAVPMLLEAIKGGGTVGDAARGSVERLLGADVDQKLVALMKDAKDSAQRNLLIEILERRFAVAAVPTLLAQYAEASPEVRHRTIAAVTRLAGPEHVGTLIKLMLKTENAAERTEIEKAVISACQRVSEGDKQSDAIFNVYAASGAAEKAVLMPLLGRLGGSKVLEIVRAALASDNADEYENGLQAICNWPDASAAGDLLKLAQNAKTPEQRVRALRAMARVVVLQGHGSNKDKLAMLKKGLELAARNQDRSLVAERASALRDIETLRFVVPLLDDPAVAQAACRTVVELAHHKELREPNKDEFEKALDKVLLVCKDRKLIERAAKYKTGPWPMRDVK